MFASSTSTQAEDGLSLDAQRAAITAYCSAHDIRLLRIYTDVESGAKRERRGLEEALAARADVFVVLKFDRLSRSIKHFCQLYEDYFSQSMELVAIREAIKLDSALGRALVSILLVFAQMEREAIGERTRDSDRSHSTWRLSLWNCAVLQVGRGHPRVGRWAAVQTHGRQQPEHGPYAGRHPARARKTITGGLITSGGLAGYSRGH